MGSASTGIDLDERIEGLEAWREKFAQSEVTQKVAADTAANRESFFNYISSQVS